jgi:hypothetical protein
MVSSWSEVDEELPDEAALETELVRVMAVEPPEEAVAETLLSEARLELAAAAEEVLARLALTMLDDNEVATGSGVFVWPCWHEIRVMCKAAAILHNAL